MALRTTVASRAKAEAARQLRQAKEAEHKAKTRGRMEQQKTMKTSTTNREKRKTLRQPYQKNLPVDDTEETLEDVPWNIYQK